ncbi:hypothetical protein BU23DRAFT_241935 [Bimuria novae-zelandiae CBS 107.79]|uniref:SAP domain-containing protein n=1 Tax=Bimuria novae-zelandiae CBS 107.79 TaxID=1447943 RepID=A0A6A5UX37_9PLEO|nr:hypothetical protein BU23DRAFT_241935 [Bimuria novae-zelandiae CBS 107.79]
MTNYNKRKNADLAALLERRGLDSHGTKTQMIARLKKQDAEDAAAEKATATAIQAASTPSARNKGNVKGTSTGEKGRANRADITKRSDAMRKERLEKGKKGKSAPRELKDGDENVVNVVNEQADDDLVKELMAGGYATKDYRFEEESGDNSCSIVVNMTPDTPITRSSSRARTRWQAEQDRKSSLSSQRKASSASSLPKDKTVTGSGLTYSDTAAIRLSSSTTPSKIPLPDHPSEFDRMIADFEKTKQELGAVTRREISVVFKVFIGAFVLALAYVLTVGSGGVWELITYVKAFVVDTALCVWNATRYQGYAKMSVGHIGTSRPEAQVRND